MEINQEIKKAIKFSRLKLSDDEQKEFFKEIKEILTIFDTVDKYKNKGQEIENVEFLPQKVINKFREDIIEEKINFEIDKDKISWGPKL